MTAIHLGLEIDPNATLPRITYELTARSGFVVQSFTSCERAIAQRDILRAKGSSVRLVETTTITIAREIE